MDWIGLVKNGWEVGSCILLVGKWNGFAFFFEKYVNIILGLYGCY